MRIALTHEQADLDALGALLAAHLVDETLLPVLPRRMNRNGRAFLNLYEGDLPFIDPRDLPVEPIDFVMLVDTQSLVTLKGLTSHTQIRVIDHHSRRPDQPPKWSVALDQTGACTTLLVESLQEQNGIMLNVSQATLLLLGIYEDTGSLTYTNTTSRDARAAAFLMEHGASLDLLSRFLNTPLSDQQLAIYGDLLKSAQTLSINGQTIIIACAEALETTDEISSIAHKLRDTLDPDGLFVLVVTPEGIRFIARSTTNQINVAGIAAAFGGGGHERASAALIHPEIAGTIAENRQKLIELLPRHVKPAITVGQIMSRRPRLLSRDTTAQEAAQLMSRYGYEGYPVVENGAVIGLLTRRSVDRAISHKLNLNAASMMEGGAVTVQPDHSLEHLQRVMADSGWGQVPVVDPVKNEIVGIVTRTDLIKNTPHSPNRPGPQNLAKRLETALPPARLALLKAVAEEAVARHNPIYIVGGFVRDLLLERPGVDFDVVVEGDAISLARALTASLGGRVVSHGRFGTAKWHIADDRATVASRLDRQTPATKQDVSGQAFDPTDLPDSLDIITARSEYYEHPSALPTVERSGIKLDLHRRDFTINTMALRLDGHHYGELHDYWGGLTDLNRGLVRVLHSLSFIDDPTRLLRAVRFEQRFGFEIENRTLELMKEGRPILKQVSGERLHHELDLILAEERAATMLARLEVLEILPAIHPDLSWEPDRAALFPTSQTVQKASDWNLHAGLADLTILQVLRYLAWLAPLPKDQLNALIQRLKLHGALVQALLDTHALIKDLPTLAGYSPSQVVRRLDRSSIIAIFTAAWLTLVEAERQTLFNYTISWRTIFPETNGHTLEALGLRPSPIFHTILDTLRDGWLDGKIQTPEEERAVLMDMIERFKSDSSDIIIQ